MQDLCELASSGSNQYFLFALTICVILFGAIAFLHNRKLLKTGHVFTILVAVFIGFSSYHFVSAADANCNNNSTDQNSGANDNNGLLVDDSQSLTGDSGIYTSNINVLSNDNAPEGDPFDIDTLAFSGLPSATSSLGFTTYFSLDPNDSTLPDPDSPWTMSVPANVWGWWEPELACDNVDGIYCGSTPTPGETVCLDNSTNACYLTGYVTASFVSNAPADQYSLQYTVTTQGGISLDPATVTVTLPVIISSDPFYDSYAGGGNCGIYDPWDSGWSFDIMSMLVLTAHRHFLHPLLTLTRAHRANKLQLATVRVFHLLYLQLIQTVLLPLILPMTPTRTSDSAIQSKMLLVIYHQHLQV